MSGAPACVLLTGATGLLGGHVLRTWQREAPSPRILVAVRGEGGRTPPGIADADRVSLDLASTIRLPEGVDTVVHVAGEKRDPARMAEVNAHGTRRLVEAAAAAGVRRFVYVSSVGSYGAPAHSGEVDESFPHTPRNAYESSKDAGETHVRVACAAAGMDAVVLQPSNVIGRVPGQSAPLLGLMRMVARRRFAWFGHAQPVVNYVGVEDVAAAIVAAAGRAPAGTYIVNTPCRLVDLVGWVAEELRVPAPTLRLPRALGRALAGAGDLAGALARRSMPLNAERFLELTNTTRYAPDRLMREAGFAYPMGIERLIRELARGYIAEELV